MYINSEYLVLVKTGATEIGRELEWMLVRRVPQSHDWWHKILSWAERMLEDVCVCVCSGKWCSGADVTSIMFETTLKALIV